MLLMRESKPLHDLQDEGVQTCGVYTYSSCECGDVRMDLSDLRLRQVGLQTVFNGVALRDVGNDG